MPAMPNLLRLIWDYQGELLMLAAIATFPAVLFRTGFEHRKAAKTVALLVCLRVVVTDFPRLADTPDQLLIAADAISTVALVVMAVASRFFYPLVMAAAMLLTMFAHLLVLTGVLAGSRGYFAFVAAGPAFATFAFVTALANVWTRRRTALTHSVGN